MPGELASWPRMPRPQLPPCAARGGARRQLRVLGLEDALVKPAARRARARACPALCPRPQRLLALREPCSGDRLCSRKRSSSATGAAATTRALQLARHALARSALPLAKLHLTEPDSCAPRGRASAL